MTKKEKISNSNSREKNSREENKEAFSKKEILPQDQTLINQIIKYFQENIRNIISKKLADYYHIIDYKSGKLSGLIKETEDYYIIITLQNILYEIQRQLNLTTRKDILFSEAMFNVILENAKKIYIKKKNTNKKLKSNQNKNRKNRNEDYNNNPYGWIM